MLLNGTSGVGGCFAAPGEDALKAKEFLYGPKSQPQIFVLLRGKLFVAGALVSGGSHAGTTCNSSVPGTFSRRAYFTGMAFGAGLRFSHIPNNRATPQRATTKGHN